MMKKIPLRLERASSQQSDAADVPKCHAFCKEWRAECAPFWHAADL